MASSRAWGLKTYEQDWLHNEFTGLDAVRHPELKVRTPAHTKHPGWYLEFEFRLTQVMESATLGREWLMQMGSAALRSGLTVQYDTSRRRECHFTDTRSPSILEHLLNGEGGASE